MLVLFTGSRELKPTDRPVIAEGLRAVVGDDPGPHTLLQGAAKGGDRLAGDIASRWGWTVRTFPADWDGPCRETCRPDHRRRKPWGSGTTCPAAGMYRNADMVAEAPDAGLAVYKRGARNRGTSECRKLAAAAGIPMTRRTA